MIYIIIIFSLLLEASISNVVNLYSIFFPLFLITSLSILYPYFKKNNQKFIITSIICGFIYDIVFTHSLFINTLSFGLISLFIIICYNYINYNIISSGFINIITIIVYQTINYFLLCTIDYLKFNEISLLKCISSSIILNVVYGIIIYALLKLFFKKLSK